MATELQELVDEYIDPDDQLPGELILDEYHPRADEFMVARREIESKIFAFGRQMKPKHRELARLIRAPLELKDVAKKLNKSTQTIRSWCKRDDIIRMVSLLDYQAQQIEGATTEHRKGVLWRIILDNEEKRPNISVQAMQEFNKMSGAYQQEGGNNGNVVNIQINGDLMPRGALDVLPETYETRVLNGPDSTET
jgi:hypothetical protein